MSPLIKEPRRKVYNPNAWTARDSARLAGVILGGLGGLALLFGIFAASAVYSSIQLVISGNELSLSLLLPIAASPIAVVSGTALLRLGLGVYFARNKAEVRRIIRRFGKSRN